MITTFLRFSRCQRIEIAILAGATLASALVLLGHTPLRAEDLASATVTENWHLPEVVLWRSQGGRCGNQEEC